jgi:hypothetical protein
MGEQGDGEVSGPITSQRPIEGEAYTKLFVQVGQRGTDFAQATIKAMQAENPDIKTTIANNPHTMLEPIAARLSQLYPGVAYPTLGEAVDLEAAPQPHSISAILQTMLSEYHSGIDEYTAARVRRAEVQTNVKLNPLADLKAHLTNAEKKLLCLLADPSNSQSWGINFDTRLQAAQVARLMTSYLQNFNPYTPGANLGNRLAEFTDDIEVGLRKESPPLTAEEIGDTRFNIDEKMAPGWDHQDTGGAPTRSQARGRGLPGRYSRQPENPKDRK